ncbi:MAG: dTMP kinase [Candidatus Bipolaricaulota bacterium]|nr:dTMP kinase [Candidatus Bipolaricaulota bacterium]MCS7275010.1 dTMP kinase [Candidatus Bipolaricaulota bacterium]MDW8110525.1 dTMP kinase [Candidatus Bipolaricaulota bacterium]MDW8329324.1 dTMP kinase [Candidatus Bipolaricaulota bacterium]
MFIALEGLDGCGKSTQLRALAQRLRQCGIDPVIVQEPGGTPVGEKIRVILLHQEKLKMTPLTELLLYEASRSELTETVIRPALAAGRWVLTDRYALSSLAYQGYGRGLDLELVRELNRLATGGLNPQVTFLLDVPVEVALRRKGSMRDRVEESGVEFYERVRRGYLTEISRIAGGVLLDGQKEISGLSEEVWSYIRPLVAVPS